MLAVFVVIIALVIFGLVAISFMAKKARSAAQKAATAKMVAANKRKWGSKAKSTISKGQKMFSKGGRSKPIFPLIDIMQAVYITQAATGNRLDDFVMVLLNYLTNIIATGSTDNSRQLLVQLVGIVNSAIMALINKPVDTFVNVTIAACVTAGARKIASMAGVPATVDCGRFYLQVR